MGNRDGKTIAVVSIGERGRGGGTLAKMVSDESERACQFNAGP